MSLSFAKRARRALAVTPFQACELKEDLCREKLWRSKPRWNSPLLPTVTGCGNVIVLPRYCFADEMTICESRSPLYCASTTKQVVNSSWSTIYIGPSLMDHLAAYTNIINLLSSFW